MNQIEFFQSYKKKNGKYNTLHTYCDNISKTDKTRFHNIRYKIPMPVLKKSKHKNLCTSCDIDPTLKMLSATRSAASFSNPAVWGGKAWKFIHSIAEGFPDEPTTEQLQSARQFFNNLHFMLPCQKCCVHCKDNLKKNPPRFTNKQELKKWLISFHNDVNKMLNKPIYTPTNSPSPTN